MIWGFFLQWIFLYGVKTGWQCQGPSVQSLDTAAELQWVSSLGHHGVPSTALGEETKGPGLLARPACREKEMGRTQGLHILSPSGPSFQNQLNIIASRSALLHQLSSEIFFLAAGENPKC